MLINIFKSDNSKLACNANGQPLFRISMMKMNIDMVERKLGIKSSNIPNNNVTEETLQMAGEMFTYLNLCSL